MKVDFRRMQLKNIDGTLLQGEFYKVLANLLYVAADSLDFVETAMNMHKEGTVEVTAKQIEEIRQVVLGPKSNLVTHAKKTIDTFLNVVLEEEAAKPKPE